MIKLLVIHFILKLYSRNNISIIDVRLAYKSFLSRFSMLINYTMWSSNLFCCIQLFPTFFIVQDFQICQGLGFSESRFFRVWVQGLSPGFRSSQFFGRCFLLNMSKQSVSYKNNLTLFYVNLDRNQALNFIENSTLLFWLKYRS